MLPEYRTGRVCYRLSGFFHRFPMRFTQSARQIVTHAWPMLIAQLASMGMMVIDTVLLGHFNTEDLAAVAVGSGIYVAVVLALSGVVQAVAPVVAQLKGAGRNDELVGVLWQGFWLALFLAVPGIVALLHPDPLLALTELDAGVEAKARSYLGALAWGVPAWLLYRTFYVFCLAVGQPRPLMVISLLCMLAHGVLASTLVRGAWGGVWEGAALGALGCGISNALAGWLALSASLIHARTSKRLREYWVFPVRRWPRLDVQRELLRLGMPMGFSSFVEISAFTFIALFVAQLGVAVVAGHRIVANLAGICYMLPLSLALATLPGVGQAVGARDWGGARTTAMAGLAVAGVVSTLFGLVLWFGRVPLIDAYTDDPAVRGVCFSLLPYLASYQIFDAVQTVAAHVLRAYKVTFLPMLVHVAAFWGVGLFGGWWLGLRASPAMGAAGFWLASLLSLVFVSVLLGGLLSGVARTRGR